MVFSGKASKGCLPCREKRTKCDLAQPSCSQCIRKNRQCTGYRKEQDIVFKFETPQAGRKGRQKKASLSTSQSRPSGPGTSVSSPEILVQKPSRKAALDDEAVCHYLGHYNEKFFASFGRTGETSGVDYISPIYQFDEARGGPAAGIIAACGFGTLARFTKSPELMKAARVRYTKILRQLQQQLQDPSTAVTDSSLLTCLSLASFELVVACEPESMKAFSEHLKGAAILAELRGKAQFYDSVSHGLYVRMRGMLIMQCLQERKPLPAFIIKHMDDKDLAQRDFEPAFIRLLIRSCQLLARHKAAGAMDKDLAVETQQLMDDWHVWRPMVGAWSPNSRPSMDPLRTMTDPDEIYHTVWLAVAYIYQQSSQMLISDLQIEWARAEHLALNTPAASVALDDAIGAQLALSETIKDAVLYYTKAFATCHMASRLMGAHSVLWPLSNLLQISTTTGEDYLWCAKQAARIADVFGLPMAQMVADMIWMGIRAAAAGYGGGAGQGEGGDAKGMGEEKEGDGQASTEEYKDGDGQEGVEKKKGEDEQGGV